MIEVIKDTATLKSERGQEKSAVGFVPTMGNLHAGHISLLERALTDFPTVYFSIFVNPKQFGPHEDFNRYPRTLENDINLIEKCLKRFPNSKVVVYAPQDPQEVFPEKSEQMVSVMKLSTILEGALRPGHFDGVATVVHRLFDLVKPRRAYFGLKDYQQYLVIRQMVKDLQLPIEIAGMPIIREQEGLALSSRNQYLSEDQKSHSLLLSRTLKQIETIIAGKKSNIPEAKKYIEAQLKDKNWNYLELRDAESLSENLSGSSKLTLLAVYQQGTTRLLDNLQMEVK